MPPAARLTSLPPRSPGSHHARIVCIQPVAVRSWRPRTRLPPSVGWIVTKIALNAPTAILRVIPLRTLRSCPPPRLAIPLPIGTQLSCRVRRTAVNARMVRKPSRARLTSDGRCCSCGASGCWFATGRAVAAGCSLVRMVVPDRRVCRHSALAVRSASPVRVIHSSPKSARPRTPDDSNPAEVLRQGSGDLECRLPGLRVALLRAADRGTQSGLIPLTEEYVCCQRHLAGYPEAARRLSDLIVS